MDDLDIAIVGLACEFPGARNAAQFWRNLADGVESISRLSDEEILRAGVPPEDLASPAYVKAAPVLEEPGGFDAAYFGFTPAEARTMDPQHRILLELASAALEDAGCDPARFPGRIGVFAGAAMNTYFMHAGLGRQFARDYIPTLIYNDKDFLATRLSYKLNLKGPSVTVQTACSTSLVAVHLARQSLLSGESDLMLAGAISVRVPHRAGYFADAGGVVSPDGRVRAFDRDANGTVFGSGGGVVVLKRLRDAIEQGDNIRAVIKGSAINNDGAEKAGYTAPGVESQAEAVIEALANAGVEAESITYLEAHGSGTPVGDPIEIRALTKAFRASTRRSSFCAIGSVKTNIGHLDAAAGMASLIKTVLALQHRQIPASLHYSRPNPEIDFPSTPFYVNARLAPWPAADGPRRAGIMSTGMGGTNAHVVLEEAPPASPSAPSGHPSLLVLSARTESALAASAREMGEFLAHDPPVDLEDAAYTLQLGRQARPHRRFVVAANRAEAIAALSAKAGRFSTGHAEAGSARPVIFLLPGVGDQYVGMGRELYLAFGAFRTEIDRCTEILRPLLGLDLRDLLYPRGRDWQKVSASGGIDLKEMIAGNLTAPEDEDARRLNEALHVQPALFALEYALARLWSHLGIEPQALAGHSMGEYVAACLAGVFSLEDALRLIVHRTQLVGRLPAARMLAVLLPEAELQPLLPGDLSIALINGPSLCVVAGPVPAVEEFAQRIVARGVQVRPVQNTHAFHSRWLEPIAGAFEARVREVRLHPPRIPFISNVTGNWISNADATDPAYWSRHLHRTARFSDALGALWRMPRPLFLEAGPGNTLSVLACQHPARPAQETPLAVTSLRHRYENRSDLEVLLNACGKLWVAGHEPLWERLSAGAPRRKISLPAYPFERQLFWLEDRAEPAEAASPEPALAEFERWFYVPSWERAPLEEMAAETPKPGILWLVFSDPEGSDHGFRELLAGEGAAIELVSFGQAFAPRSFDDYLQLFRHLEAHRWAGIHLVHLGCIDPGSPEPLARERLQDFGFFSLMQIAQAVGELDLGLPITMAVVSSGLHAVIGGEALNPTMAAALGPCGVIPREFPNIACFNVDLPSGDVSALHRQWIRREFARPLSGETLAYRGPHRWRRKAVPVSLRPPAEAAPREGGLRPDRLRERGVYLITGGTGGIGLAVARHLALTCRARIILTRRTSLPEKTQWRDLLQRADTPPETARILRPLLEIESLGAEIEVVAAEASDGAAMRSVLEGARRRFGALHGVVHAAGIVRAGLVQTKTRALAESVLAPKVTGTWILHGLLEGAELDFLVLFSSVTALLTPLAESDYSGANAFLDAFAAFSEGCRPYRVLSIGWPGWKETGQLAELKPAPGAEAWKTAALEKAILTRDGIEAFRRALASTFSQVIVSPTDLEQERRQAHALPLASAEPKPDEEAAGDLPSVVTGIWAAVFGLPRIGPEESFIDLGGNSLLALQIVTRVRARYGVHVTLREFFQAPTISQLSARIEEKLIEEIANLSDDEVRDFISGAADHAHE